MEIKKFTNKKVFLRTFGCQMNVRDSEVACGLLKNAGFELTDDPKACDIVIINTCAVRQHAEERVWSEVGRHKDKIVGIIGCIAQEQKERIFERAPNIGFVVGPADIAKLPEIIKKVVHSSSSNKGPSLFEVKIWETDSESRPEEIYHTGFYSDRDHAYVVISEGCSNFCSYCIVPYVRGALRNRDYREILKEIEQATEKGITKITFLGQNVNAYNSGDVNFAKLLELTNKVKELKKISFFTSHPKDTSIELFKAIASCEKLEKGLHLPLQSGCDRILKLMNRGYTKKFYEELIKEYRKIVKGADLTTDVIVGFPTETEEEFLETFDFIKAIKPNAAFIFKYSQRPGTEAAKMADTVSREEKVRRHKLILDLQRGISKPRVFKE